MLSFTLKSAGYEVDEAADGKEGLGKAQSKSYSLVFTDQNMPNMDRPAETARSDAQGPALIPVPPRGRSHAPGYEPVSPGVLRGNRGTPGHRRPCSTASAAARCTCGRT
ncbi:hypothetical protein RLJV_23480 [Pseudomonas aeruginosa]|nr:hypothetical protein RLJV_23480 [Pseudomonas aeruginosa]